MKKDKSNQNLTNQKIAGELIKINPSGSFSTLK